MFFDIEEFKKETPSPRAGSASSTSSTLSTSSTSSVISAKPPPLVQAVKKEPKPKTYVRPFGYIHVPREPYLLFLMKYIPSEIPKHKQTSYDIKYMLCEDTYKKALYNDDIKELYSHYIDIIPKTKLKYIQEPYTYKNFLTFTRQICNQFDWNYENRVKYMYNVYHIQYDIYIPARIIEALL